MSHGEFISITELGKLIEELESSTPEDRVQFFANPSRFFLWWYFYYPESFKCDLALFHFEWMYYFSCTDLNILNESIRSSLKTEMTKLFVIRSICYKTISYCVWQSNDSDSSEEQVRNISRMLSKPSLVADYGDFFPFSMKKADFASSGSTNFDTTNGIKVKAKSTQEKIRGAWSYDEDEGTTRPDLLVLDDIDTTESVRNKDIIDKNEIKLRQETIGAMNKGKSRIIFLWNTIANDGIVRRFAQQVKNDPRWVYLRQPLYDEETWECVWPEFFTPEVIEDIKSKEWDSFAQNYLLIPKITIGTTVFDTTQQITVVNPYKTIEWFQLFQHPQDKLVIGVDIAEWGLKSDNSVLKARNHEGQSVFEFAGVVDEKILAQKLDYILTQYYEKRDKSEREYKYLGTILIESNVWRAFINECMKYPWFQYVLKARKLDGTEEEGIVQKYWFRTTAQSKQLIIREFRNALYRNEIDITPGTLNEMYTYQYDKNNSANALPPNHDDRIIADMIAYHGVIHESFVVEYDKDPIDEDLMTPIQRHLYRLRNPRNDDEFEYE